MHETQFLLIGFSRMPGGAKKCDVGFYYLHSYEKAF